MKKKLPILLIILSAFLLRFYGLNWDQGHHLHPDERMIVMVTERISFPEEFNLKLFFSPESPLNPRFFPYGSFPLYLLKGFSLLVASLFGSSWATYQQLPILGRLLSLVFDLMTIGVIFRIGKKIFSEKVGLLAAFFYAVCVLPVQLSHFYAVDVILNFFIWLTILKLITFYEKPSLASAARVGISFGFALATKVSATVLLVAIGVTGLVDLLLLWLKLGGRKKIKIKMGRSFFERAWRSSSIKSIISNLIRYGLVILVLAGATFFILEPYAVFDFSEFWRQISEQQAMTKNAYVFPYTLQYVGTAPYWYFLKQMVVWGMGLFLGVVCLIGVVFYGVSLFRRLREKGNFDKEAMEIIVFVFGLVYFLVIGRFAVKFMRYLLPLYPWFILYGVYFLVKVASLAKNKLFFVVFLFGGITFQLAWVFAFLSIYSRPNSRVEATKWINENIPPGATIAVEHWDDRLPLGGGGYRFLEMPLYDQDSSLAKWLTVNQNLEKADYLILASNRLYASLMRLTDCSKHERCYPKTGEYYEKLFSGELGFEKVAEFNSYPAFSLGFLKIEINDQKADESFTVYDHPRVIIFKKMQ